MPFVDRSEFGDHEDYSDLYQKVELISKKAPSNTFAVEVGTRAGGSALTILDAIRESNKKQWLITIDPYGDKPYLSDLNPILRQYPDSFYRQAMKLLSEYCEKYEMNWTHYKMKSLDWIDYWPKTEFWINGQILNLKIFFLHLDGDHNTMVVKSELDNFWPYVIDGGIVCIDDANAIDIEKVCSGLEYSVQNDRIWIKKQGEIDMAISEDMNSYFDGSLWPEERKKLVELANKSEGEFIFEIGVFKGHTTKYLLENTSKKVIAIDPFDAHPTINYEEIKKEFFDICGDYIKSGRLIHIPKKSIDSHHYLTPYMVSNCALIYIDWPANSEEHCRDFIDYTPYISKNGYLAVHDFYDEGLDKKGMHISEAISKYMKYLNKPITWETILYYPKHSDIEEGMNIYGNSADDFYSNRSRGLIWCSPNTDV